MLKFAISLVIDVTVLNDWYFRKRFCTLFKIMLVHEYPIIGAYYNLQYVEQ